MLVFNVLTGLQLSIYLGLVDSDSGSLRLMLADAFWDVHMMIF